LRWINHVIGMGKDVDILFLATMMRAAEAEETKRIVSAVQATMSPDEKTVTDDLSREIAAAIMEAGCANSQFVRWALPVLRWSKKPVPVATQYDGLTASALAGMPVPAAA
jgi:hypothetical protein